MQSRLKFLENSFKINMLAPAWKCNGGGEGGGGGGYDAKNLSKNAACKHTVLTTSFSSCRGREAEVVAMKTRFILI